MTGAQACQELAALPEFGSNNRIPAYSGEAEKADLAKTVLMTMNQVHASWQTIKRFAATNRCFEASTKATVDALEPALYFTRALYDPDENITTVLKGTDQLRAIRSVANPTVSIFESGVERSEFEGWNPLLVPYGDLLGVDDHPAQTVAKLSAFKNDEIETAAPERSNVNVRQGAGGGALGSPAYLLNNFGDDVEFVTNVERMARQWSKYIFSDFLCRDLPVIDDVDADRYEVCTRPDCAIKPPAAKVAEVLPFRNDKACVKCHASMDQLAGLVRNHRFMVTGDKRCRLGGDDQTFNSVHVVPVAANLPLSRAWPYTKDNDYHKRPGTGVLYYRDFNNRLVSVQLDNLTDLGNALLERDDFYICTAKRYYQYFTGIDADIGPMTAAKAATLHPSIQFYRNRVKSLGLELKSHKSSLRLIQKIFDLPEYRQKDLRVEELSMD